MSKKLPGTLADCKKVAAGKARAELAAAYTRYSLEGLRWDYGCNISAETKKMIHDEVERRGVAWLLFEQMGRGRREGGNF